MKEIRDDIWKYHDQGYVVITTNGFVKENGECVMGRGIALQAKGKYPSLPILLGTKIQEEGNRVFEWDALRLFTFPVKENWWEPAKQGLIQRSCQGLLNLMGERDIKVFIPRAGCQNGKLDWLTQVKPIFLQEFDGDERITVVDRRSE